jgi:hypothetical protein
MATLISALITLVSMVLDVVGRLIGAVFQVIFLLASCAPDRHTGWPGGENDEPRWDDRVDVDDDYDLTAGVGYNLAARADDSDDDQGIYRNPWFR